MAIVNFAIPQVLDRRIGSTIKAKGFASKAEFFRFAAVYFMDVIDKPFVTEGERTEYLVGEIEREIRLRKRRGPLPSMRSQLQDI